MSDVNIAISNDVIKGIIQKKLETTIAASLGGEVQLLEALVRNCLTMRVDSSGSRSTYQRSEDMDLIEWLCREAIKAQASAAIKAWVELSKPKIEAEIRKQLGGQVKNCGHSRQFHRDIGAQRLRFHKRNLYQERRLIFYE